MRRRTRAVVLPLTLFLIVSLFLGIAAALEKTLVRIGDRERPDDWSAQLTCSVAYYNYCTGWIWVWGGWSPYDVVGVVYETCCPHWDNWPLHTTWELVYTTAPAGRSLTGTIDIWSADENCCPASLLAGQPFYFFSGWNGHDWGGLLAPGQFLVTVTCGPGFALPSRFASDHPAAGPTGPQACGTCYQLHRLTHSYYFGVSGAMLCPGEMLNDGVCDVEWIWDVAMSCPISIEESTWAKMKALYR